jgi:hypothetical protein
MEDLKSYEQLRRTFVPKAVFCGALVGASILAMVISSRFDRSNAIAMFMSIILMFAPVRIFDKSLVAREPQ